MPVSSSQGTELGARRALKIPKMAEVIAAELRSKILSGELPPDESLMSESTLMDLYGVSRPTLREALRLLESQQLIVVRRGSHRGPVVNLPDVSVTAQNLAIQLQLRDATLGDVFEFAKIMEPNAVAMATAHVRAADIKYLRGRLDRIAAENLSQAEYAEESRRFHLALIDLAGNHTMKVVAEAIEKISTHHNERVMALSDDIERQQQGSQMAHYRVLELMEEGDPEVVRQYWSRHVSKVSAVMARGSDSTPITELLD